MRRIVYALILITILALFTVLPGDVVTGEPGYGKPSATVTVFAWPGTAPSPPSPPSPGGDGGTYRTSPPPTPSPPGTTDVSHLVTATGVFIQRVIIQSADKMSQLIIVPGVLGLTGDGEPLSVISIMPVEAPPAPPEDSYIIGLVYSFGPDRATFDPPVIVAFTYDESLIPEGVAEENLVIAVWDAARRQWVALEGSVVYPQANTVAGPVSNFTSFTIMAYIRLAAFTASDLFITPTEVDIGEAVDITILVANTGGQSGSHEVTLRVNGVVEASKTVELAAGGSELVSFSTIKDTAGTYSLEVAGLIGSFTVKEKPVAPPTVTPPAEIPPAEAPPITPPPFTLPVIGGIIAALTLVGAWLAYFFLYRRYKYAAGTHAERLKEGQ